MGPEIECSSMKILLKQVYGFHTSKIKSLEDEIDDLKRNLQDAEMKIRNYDSECKRCIELEAAFNSCKAALHEQSKLFENLGQKFSCGNAAENRNGCDKILKDTANSSKMMIHDESKSQIATVKKMDLSTNAKIHFLKNIMSLNTDDFQESLDLSAPFQKNFHQEYSTLNPDSLVLVPNTAGLENEVSEEEKESDGKNDLICPQILLNGKKISKDQGKGSPSSTDSFQKPQNKDRVRKRLSDDTPYFDLNAEKTNKENELKSSRTSKKLKMSLKPTDVCQSVIKQVQNENISPKEKNSKKDLNLSVSNNLKKNIIPSLNIEIHKSDQNNIVVPNNATNITLDKESINKNDSFQATVSPSLIPLSEKTNTKAVKNLPSSSEDISDFQIPSVGKKTSDEGSSWTSCDKKKLSKKANNSRPIKSTSKFKIQLDSLPPNFRKPSYRQTKLSKSIFQAKSSSQKKLDIENGEGENVFCDFEKKSPSASPTLHANNNHCKTVDFDATCIPDNYEYEVISSGKQLLKSSDRDFDNSILSVKDSADESDEENSSELIIRIASPKKSKGSGEGTKSKHVELSELGNSFDRLPKKPEPDYKYKEETVRKKSERKQLNAFDCNECEKYYSELGLSDEEKQKRMHKCSRHRAKFAPPPTPDHFWELEFPDTQECKARGYLNETQKASLKTHRKRPL